MLNNAFITAASLACSLGNKDEEIIKSIKNLNNENFIDWIEQNKNNLYSIKNSSSSKKKQFYNTLEFIINDVIAKANLSLEDRENLHIFIGSTSFKISVDEEELNEIGYKIIGDFVKKISGSKQDFTIFSTSCTSSANAIIYANKFIKTNKIKKALVIGFEFFNKATKEGFESFRLLSKNNIYKPFDKTNEGIILGESCSALILEEKAKNNLDFEIKSYFSGSEVYSPTSANEDGLNIAKSLKNTLLKSKLDLNDIDFIKLHGTGSQNNMIAELKALELFFQESPKKIKLTTLKPYLGHTLGACGTSEIALILLCLKDGFIPASLNSKDEHLNFIQCPQKAPKKLNFIANYIGFNGNVASVLIGNK